MLGLTSVTASVQIGGVKTRQAVMATTTGCTATVLVTTMEICTTFPQEVSVTLCQHVMMGRMSWVALLLMLKQRNIIVYGGIPGMFIS